MVRWEYANFAAVSTGVVLMINGVLQDIANNPKKPFEVLNKMGEEGWEMVAALPVYPPSPDSVGGASIFQFFLKRPK